MFHSPERRDSPRCKVVENQSRLEFAVPEGRRRVEATLVNISRGAPARHRKSSGVSRICLDPDRKSRENRLGRSDDGAHRAERGSGRPFPQGCPDDLLLAGTIGIDLVSMVIDPARLASNFD